MGRPVLAGSLGGRHAVTVEAASALAAMPALGMVPLLLLLSLPAACGHVWGVRHAPQHSAACTTTAMQAPTPTGPPRLGIVDYIWAGGEGKGGRVGCPPTASGNPNSPVHLQLLDAVTTWFPLQMASRHLCSKWPC